MAVNASLKDAAVGYSAHLPVTPRVTASAKLSEDTYAELGLMTGSSDSMMSFPSGVAFTPYSVLRNVSDQPLLVTPTLWRMQAGAPRSSQLPQITMQPHQTQKLDVTALLASAGLKNFNGSVNLVLDAKGQQGALLMASGSVDQSNSYVFEVVPRGAVESASKSFQYWSTANGDETMVNLWNPADEPQDFVFTLFYSGGRYNYPIHLEPRAAFSFNVSQIQHSGLPDSEGNVIPAGVQSGGAELSGSLGENQLILVAADSAVYNIRKATCGSYYCTTCNGVVTTSLVDNPFAVPVGGSKQQTFSYTYNTNTQYDVTNTSTWSSSNTAVASVTHGLTNGVAVGSATLSASYGSVPIFSVPCQWYSPPSCPPPGAIGGQAPGNVIQLTLQMNQYNSIFVGADANLAGANSIYATVSPTGGTFTKNSSQSGDTFTDVTSGGPGWVVKTTTQSASAGDRALTVTYAVSGQGQVSKTLNATARQFAYVTNNSPTNTCTLGYGTTKVYLYTPYTHPDRTAVQAGLGLSGTAVTENFDSQPPAGTVTGDGSLNSNSQFTDRISYCSSSPLTTSTTITQTISIEGYQVRQNKLQYSTSGVTYTSLGPTQ